MYESNSLIKLLSSSVMKNYQRINYTFYTNKVLYVDHMILENEKTILQFLLISILILILQRCNIKEKNI